MEMTGSHQLLVCAHGVSEHNSTKRNTEVLVVTSKEPGLEVNAEKTMCKFMICEQDAWQISNTQE
jgi:hypothetical protein